VTDKTYRVLVTGSRDWADYAAVMAVLDAVAAEHPELVVVHGHCPTGADRYADVWAQMAGLRPERHPADWARHGKAAGFRRNAEMVGLGADVCLAFIGPCTSKTCRVPPPHGSHGASHTAGLAEKAGIPTCKFFAPAAP
jgi:hypothetical protein